MRKFYKCFFMLIRVILGYIFNSNSNKDVSLSEGVSSLTRVRLLSLFLQHERSKYSNLS